MAVEFVNASWLATESDSVVEEGVPIEFQLDSNTYGVPACGRCVILKASY